MCNCIEQVRKNIKEIDPLSDINEVETYMDKNAKVGSTIAFIERMCAHFTVRLKRKDNTFSNKRHTNIIPYAYCPFCGEKYN
ncbi:hypothetical protein J6W34_09330 [bacterium]|nr:hypothetical protein [bacterium]